MENSERKVEEHAYRRPAGKRTDGLRGWVRAVVAAVAREERLDGEK